jgi:Tol biopolymer transport system component
VGQDVGRLERACVRAGVAIGVACALAAMAPVASASFPGKDGRIAYVRMSDGTSIDRSDGIFTVAPNGTGARRLTNGADYDPAWSPDGQWVAFLRGEPTGRGAIYRVRADGKQMRRLRVGADPSWSPTGLRLVFTVSTAAGQRLKTMNRNGTGVRDLGVLGEAPAWSPDGNVIAFQRRTESTGVSDIYLLDLRTMTTRNLTNNVENTEDWYYEDARSPSWSPDGSRLSFSQAGRPASECTGTSDIHTIRPDGTDEKVLQRPVMALFSDVSAWAPSGDGRIVYSAWYEEETLPECGSVWQRDLVLDTPGTSPADITHTASPVNEVQPDWQPLQ